MAQANFRGAPTAMSTSETRSQLERSTGIAGRGGAGRKGAPYAASHDPGRPKPQRPTRPGQEGGPLLRSYPQLIVEYKRSQRSVHVEGIISVEPFLKQKIPE